MPTIFQSNNSSNSLSIAAIEVERKHIKDAYFALRKDEPVYEGEEKKHTVVSGDTLGKIASNNNTTVAKIKADNNLSSDVIIIDQELIINSPTKKGDNVRFEKVNEVKAGDEVYIIVETENAQELKLKLNIKQGIEKGIVEVDEIITVQQDDKDVALIKTSVGNYCNDENVLNKDDFKDWAIAKVKLLPKDDKKQKLWNDNLDKLKDKKSKFYLLVEADTDKDYYITYHGRNPDDEGKPDYKTIPNRWLDMENKWLTIERSCDCGQKYDKQFKCVKSGSKYGPLYMGNQKLADYKYWNSLIDEGRITTEEKDILVGMSENEGNLDSIQSYDSEILTVGAMQKTINPMGKGEFPIQVEEFKKSNPDKYKNLFEECGWSADGGKIYYKDPNDSSSSKITGSALKTKIREGFVSTEYNKKIKCKPLEPIVRAAKDKDFQAKQVEDFIDRLRNKVLPLKPTGYSYRLSDFLKSKLGKALVLDHHVNRPGHVKMYFGEALNRFFKKKDEEVAERNKDKKEKEKESNLSRKPSDWGDQHSSYEKEIIKIYGPLRGEKLAGVKTPMTHATKRYNNLKSKL